MMTSCSEMAKIIELNFKKSIFKFPCPIRKVAKHTQGRKRMQKEATEVLRLTLQGRGGPLPVICIATCDKKGLKSTELPHIEKLAGPMIINHE